MALVALKARSRVDVLGAKVAKKMGEAVLELERRGQLAELELQDPELGVLGEEKVSCFRDLALHLEC